MDLSKLLELYLNLRKERGCIGFNSKEAAILNHVEDEIYSRITPQCPSQYTASEINLGKQVSWK